MKRSIPPKSTRRWNGVYPGNYYGTLWKTHNIDLDRNEGFVGLSERMELIEDSNELDSVLGSNAWFVTAFTRTNADGNDRFWALTEGALAKTDSSSTASADTDWDEDALDSTPTTNLRDFTIHSRDSRADSGDEKLFVTTDTDIFVLNDTGDNAWTGGWWVTKQSQPGLNPNVNHHPIEYFPFRKISLIGDGNLVHTIHRPSDTQNDTLSYARLTLPPRYNTRHIFVTSNRSWILCQDTVREQGMIAEWDGFTKAANNFYYLQNSIPLSGVGFKDIPIIVTTKGQFLEFTGSGFEPMIRNGQKVQFSIADEPGNAFNTDQILPRSMVLGEDNIIYTNVETPNIQGDRSFQTGSGIWALNPTSGRFYTKYSLGQYGDSTDYGHSLTRAPGALFWISSAFSNTRNLLAGGSIEVTASTANQGIWLLESSGQSSPSPQRGYFITQFIPADEIREYWDTLWLSFRQFISSTNKIIVKAKGTRTLNSADGGPLFATITWTSGTTFTVTLDSGDDVLQVGHEVQVNAGANAGYIAHITNISGAHGALQTITIDETVKDTSNTAEVYFDRWKKLGEITATDRDFTKLNIGIDSSFIQFKVELRGIPRELEVKELLIKSNNSQQVEN